MFREGSTTAVARQTIPPPDEGMLLTIVDKDGSILVAVDELPILTYKDPAPLSVKTKLCIGGYQWELVMGKVDVVDLAIVPPLILQAVVLPKGLQNVARPPQVVVIPMPTPSPGAGRGAGGAGGYGVPGQPYMPGQPGYGGGAVGGEGTRRVSGPCDDAVALRRARVAGRFTGDLLALPWGA